MANKLKNNSTKNPVDKPGKTNSDQLKPEKEEKVSFKELARDERTWKIAGAVSLFISLFLKNIRYQYLFEIYNSV